MSSKNDLGRKTVLAAALASTLALAPDLGAEAVAAASQATFATPSAMPTPASTPAPMPAPNQAAAPAPAAGSCEAILADAPTAGPYKADALCPAISSLRDLFTAAGDGNYAPTVAYVRPSDEFFMGLASSMRHYRGRPITVTVGGSQPITLAGLDTLDEANQFKRNKLGLVLERIRAGDDRGRHVGKVCMAYAEAAADDHPIVWVGSALLKYGLPALIKLLRGNPSRVIDRYDALVLTERGSGDQRTAPIRTINFVPRGTLHATCTGA